MLAIHKKKLKGLLCSLQKLTIRRRRFITILLIGTIGCYISNWVVLISTLATLDHDDSEVVLSNSSKHDQFEESMEQKTNGSQLHSEDATLLGPVLVVSSKKQARSSIYSDQGKVAAARAVWDPISGGGRGHTIIENLCQAEIKLTGCQSSLPLDICIRTIFNTISNDSNIQEMLSDPCSSVLYPCQRGQIKTRECQEYSIYRNSLTDTETHDVENILALIDQASRMTVDITLQHLDYWMTAGSMIGGVVHHGRIPWDDDIDIYVRQEHMDSLIRNVKSLGLSFIWNSFGGIANRTGKIFNSSLPMIPKHKHSFPFVDIFPVDCSDGFMCVETNSAEKYSAPIDSIFPLKRRPFGRLSMMFPVKARSILEDRYSVLFKANCKKGAYNHRTERFTGRKNYHSVNCSEMVLPPPFVSDQYDAGVSMETDPPGAIVYIPWKEDFPNLTVEHLFNDAGKRLSSILFEDGNEVRRSYSDGLMELSENVITYSFPDLLPQTQNNLLPFLYEERLSFLSNWGQRTAKELNLEVLPTLDRVVISNNYSSIVHDDVGNDTDYSRYRKILHVGEWNAARGADWDVFTNFYPNADIIILNEMDWGMARSGNKDTTKEMANYLKMNYAYGVEFMELTNGNEEEINATAVGQSNLIGYHGNVVMTKWPIIESRTVRLHPLYELLFEEKTSGMAKGERRLGGRMALFTLIRTDAYGDILAISIHAHSGSKQTFLKEDARLICKEIQKYSTTNVIIGGDIAYPIPQTLVSECDFFPLEKTNSQKGGKGSRLTPSWKVGEFSI